eukprot:1335622-Prymnesium_polylepis.1
MARGQLRYGHSSLGSLDSPCSISSSSGPMEVSSEMTPLAQAAELSDPSKLRALEEKVASLTSQLAASQHDQVKADAARSIAEAARTAAEAEVSRLRAELASMTTKVSMLQAQVATKAEAAKIAQANESNLQKQGALWSSLFMASQKIDTNAFTTLLNAQGQLLGTQPSTSQPGPSSTSQPGPASESAD